MTIISDVSSDVVVQRVLNEFEQKYKNAFNIDAIREEISKYAVDIAAKKLDIEDIKGTNITIQELSAISTRLTELHVTIMPTYSDLRVLFDRTEAYILFLPGVKKTYGKYASLNFLSDIYEYLAKIDNLFEMIKRVNSEVSSSIRRIEQQIESIKIDSYTNTLPYRLRKKESDTGSSVSFEKPIIKRTGNA